MLFGHTSQVDFYHHPIRSCLISFTPHERVHDFFHSPLFIGPPLSGNNDGSLSHASMCTIHLCVLANIHINQKIMNVFSYCDAFTKEEGRGGMIDSTL